MEIDKPKIIQDAGFDFAWDNEKVWKLEVPTTWMDISQLEWQFDLPFLDWAGGWYNLKPRDVIDHPGDYEAEYYRALQTDRIHPIDIMENHDRFFVLDGLHRLMKAAIDGKTKVPVRIIPRNLIPKILKDK